MWFDSRREIGTFDALKLFMCMLPPDAFVENQHKNTADLVIRMKSESHSNFDNLNRDSFDVDGSKKLPHCQHEVWEDFLQFAKDADKRRDEDKSDEDRKRVELWVHLRALATWINETVDKTYHFFWQCRVNAESRGDDCRKMSQFLQWNSVDKVSNFCHVISQSCLSSIHRFCPRFSIF